MTYLCEMELYKELQEEENSIMNEIDSSFSDALDTLYHIDEYGNILDEDAGMIFPQPLTDNVLF